MAIRSVTLWQRYPIIIGVTVIDIGFVLAAAAIVETLVIVVFILGSDVLPLPPPVPGLAIQKCMSTGGRCLVFVLALPLILA